MTILRYREQVLEGTDNWNVAAITAPRADFSTNVMITPSDVVGAIALDIYLPNSSTSVYSTTFSKTLTQDGGLSTAVHTALVDSRWEGLDSIGHNFAHKVRMADLTPITLNGGRLYTMVYAIPTASDGTIFAVFDWDIEPRH